jgi:hypothetical protein
MAGMKRPKFSLRLMLLAVAAISVIMWAAIQLNWIRQRRTWLSSGPPAIRSSKPQPAPGLLRFFGERGESWIEIKNGTNQQIAEAQWLFPEAIVIIEGGPSSTLWDERQNELRNTLPRELPPAVPMPD